jgi:hypothetical protein
MTFHKAGYASLLYRTVAIQLHDDPEFLHVVRWEDLPEVFDRRGVAYVFTIDEDLAGPLRRAGIFRLSRTGRSLLLKFLSGKRWYSIPRAAFESVLRGGRHSAPVSLISDDQDLQSSLARAGRSQ